MREHEGGREESNEETGRAMNLAALRGELTRLYRQRVTYMSFVVIFVLVALIAWGSHHHRERLDVQERISADFVIAGKSISALFVARAVMEVSLTVLLPLLIAVVAGALVAGERQSGTLRTLLARPVRRSSILLAKLAAGWSYAIALTVFLGVIALGLGHLVFGWGDLVVLRGGLTVFDAQTGLVRLIWGYALACAAMCTVAALALMLSTVFDSPMAAAGLTVAILLISGAVGVMPYFEAVEPHLPTTHLSIHQEAFSATIDRGALLTSAAYLAGYTLLSLAVALVVFERRDVTC